MKRMMPAMFLSAILLSGCYDDYYFEESETTAVSEIQTTTAESAEEESHTKDSTDAPSIAEVTAIPPPENASEPEPQENPPEQPDEPEPSEDISEIIELDTAEQPTTEPETSPETTTTETTTSDETEPSEPEQTTETAISEPTAEPPNITEPTTENAAESPTEPPTEPEQTDYEKALMVYDYIRENGYGTCVQYSSKTYEKCKEIGIPCQFVWTDAGIYGHVANTVCVDGIWFIMDTQAGCFLDYNYGFTEVVDKDMNHIGDADMLSNYSYSELFG